MFNFLEKNSLQQVVLETGAVDQMQEDGAETIIIEKGANRRYVSTEDIVTLYNRNVPQDMILVTDLANKKFAYSNDSIKTIRARGSGSTIIFSNAKTSKLDFIEAPAAIVNAASVSAGDPVKGLIRHPDALIDSTKFHTIRVTLDSGANYDLDLQDILLSADLKDPVSTTTYGVGNITLSGEQTLNGVLTSASRVLVTDQTNQAENGIYVTDAGAWTRATDADEDAEVSNGLRTTVLNPLSTKHRSTYVTNSSNPITVGVTNVLFTEIDANLVNNYGATAPPTVSNDDSQGYSPGSEWVDVTNDVAYIMLDAATGAAIWQKIGSGGTYSQSVQTITGASVPVPDSFSIAIGTAQSFVSRVTGYEAGTGDVFSREYYGAIKNFGGATSLVDSVSYMDIALDTGATTWGGATFTANDTSDELDISIVGELAHTINWTIETVFSEAS
jgi:hypothetical protein